MSEVLERHILEEEAFLRAYMTQSQREIWDTLSDEAKRKELIIRINFKKKNGVLYGKAKTNTESS